MSKKLFFLLFLFTFACLLHASEERELRQLHNQAESSMHRGDFSEAKEAYLKIIEKTEPYFSNKKKTLEWRTYVDTVLRLCQAYFHLKEYEEGEKQLQTLIKKQPPAEFLPQITLLLSRFLCSQNEPHEAYLRMKEISQIHPFEYWHAEERSLYKGLECLLNTHYDELLGKAKRWQISGYPSEAKNLYEEIKRDIEKGFYPKATSSSIVYKKVCYRLAEANFLLANYDQTILLARIQETPQDEWDRQKLFLCALAYKEKYDYENAIYLFNRYVESASPDELQNYAQALLEIGLFYFEKNNISKAKRSFEQLLTTAAQKGKAPALATLYLAKINIQEGNPKQAEEILHRHRSFFPPDEPLHQEWAYLNGEAAFAVKEYPIAMQHYETSLLTQTGYSWIPEVLLKLGWCHVKLGDDSLKGRAAREAFFQKAAEYFNKLLPGQLHDQACLALCRLHLVEYEHFLKQESLLAIETLLKAHFSLLSPSNAQAALLLLAEAKSSPEEREWIYLKATNEDYQHTLYYPDAWYLLGIHLLYRGIAEPQNPVHFPKAIEAFEKAYAFFKNAQNPLVNNCLFFEAKAYHYRHLPLLSLNQLEQILNALPKHSSQKEEILYLKSLVAASTGEEWGQTLGKEILAELLLQFPDGDYAPASLYLLGTICFHQGDYEKAYNSFSCLHQRFSNCSLAPEGLFWAAEAGEKIGIDPAPLRSQLMMNRPQHLLSEKASFRLYSLAQYTEGNPGALAHLTQFSLAFPQSAYLIPSFYFLGLHAEERQEAKNFYKKALSQFDKLTQQDQSLSLFCSAFRHRSQLALARLEFYEHLHPEGKNACLKRLESLVSYLRQVTSKPEELGEEESTFSLLYQESALTLVKFWKENQQRSQARELIAQLLKEYAEKGIEQGEFLAKTWFLQGELAIDFRDTQTALNCFEMSEHSSGGKFTAEEKISLWIAKSTCYRLKGELETAMRWLSKAINEDAVSPLRVKAMLLRAEIYELQGRPELAVRQLEATAKKGGEWALEAKDKLGRDYGIR